MALELTAIDFVIKILYGYNETFFFLLTMAKEKKNNWESKGDYLTGKSKEKFEKYI